MVGQRWGARVALLVRDVAAAKPQRLLTILPEATVQAAVQIMGSQRISALPVVENDRLVGIVSERDYVRKVASLRIPAWSVKIHEIMTQDVVTVAPEDSILECMRLMAAHRIRHLPIMESGRLVGIVSITDLVRALDAD
jgi:CBS domain-containing protein